jgi:biopolymer transport protein ExbD
MAESNNAMKRASRASQHTLNELNITPLLDLVFVLLVIFIITTPQLVNSLEMSLPSNAPRPTPAAEAKPVRLYVDSRGRNFLNDKPFDLAPLRAELQSLKAANSMVSVVVNADDNANYQPVVTLLDLLQQLNITRVGLATDPGGPAH